MANAIEELLRYNSSVQVTGRTTLEDVEEIGGIRLEKGQSVVCLLGSANRDPAIYRDPDRLDITRRDVRPLSFGGGIHYCVGAQLARIEGEIAIATLLRRLPNCGLMTSIIPIGGRHLSCAASTSYQLVGRSSPGPPRVKARKTAVKYPRGQRDTEPIPAFLRYSSNLLIRV